MSDARHRDLRAGLDEPFRVGAIETWAGSVTSIATELIDQVLGASTDQFEVVSAFRSPCLPG